MQQPGSCGEQLRNSFQVNPWGVEGRGGTDNTSGGQEVGGHMRCMGGHMPPMSTAGCGAAAGLDQLWAGAASTAWQMRPGPGGSVMLPWLPSLGAIIAALYLTVGAGIWEAHAPPLP